MHTLAAFQLVKDYHTRKPPNLMDGSGSEKGDAVARECIVYSTCFAYVPHPAHSLPWPLATVAFDQTETTAIQPKKTTKIRIWVELKNCHISPSSGNEAALDGRSPGLACGQQRHKK